MISRTNTSQGLQIPGKVTIAEGQGSFGKVFVCSGFSAAEIYLHGAHVTHFARHGEQPLLFCSQQSKYQSGSAIRGGVPIIFPWFGAREGEKLAHGFARLAEWDLTASGVADDGSVELGFSLPEKVLRAPWAGAKVTFSIRVGRDLQMELRTLNGSQASLEFENCLHTYFRVGDIAKVSVHGLQHTQYLDKTDNFAEKTDKGASIKIAAELDRTYLDTASTVTIEDHEWRRKILVEKSGSNSTVVWNPWIEKAKQMADFGDDEYRQMICVESGNIARNKIRISAGEKHILQVTLRSEAL